MNLTLTQVNISTLCTFGFLIISRADCQPAISTWIRDLRNWKEFGLITNLIFILINSAHFESLCFRTSWLRICSCMTFSDCIQMKSAAPTLPPSASYRVPVFKNSGVWSMLAVSVNMFSTRLLVGINNSSSLLAPDYGELPGGHQNFAHPLFWLKSSWMGAGQNTRCRWYHHLIGCAAIHRFHHGFQFIVFRFSFQNSAVAVQTVKMHSGH